MTLFNPFGAVIRDTGIQVSDVLVCRSDDVRFHELTPPGKYHSFLDFEFKSYKGLWCLVYDVDATHVYVIVHDKQLKVGKHGLEGKVYGVTTEEEMAEAGGCHQPLVKRGLPDIKFKKVAPALFPQFGFTPKPMSVPSGLLFCLDMEGDFTRYGKTQGIKKQQSPHTQEAEGERQGLQQAAEEGRQAGQETGAKEAGQTPRNNHSDDGLVVWDSISLCSR